MEDILQVFDYSTALFFIFGPFIIAHFCTEKEADKSKRNGTLFLLYLVIGVGFQGILSGLWQVFQPVVVAKFEQWPLSPFVFELGMANIAFGILGILSPWMDNGWRMSTGIGYSIFLLLTGILHLVRIVLYGPSPGDVGGFLLSDLFVGTILFSLVISTKKSTSTESNM